MRRLAIGLAVLFVLMCATVGLSLTDPRGRAVWTQLEDRAIWKNPRVTHGLEATLSNCAIDTARWPIPIAAMIVQDRADPCPGIDRLPSLLRPHLTPFGERMLLAYLGRHRVSDTALRRFVAAELVAGRPVPALAWQVLDAVATSPRLRFQMASDVLESRASDVDAAIDRLPRIHGIGTTVLLEAFADGDESHQAAVVEALVSFDTAPLRPLPTDADFARWTGERVSRGVGLRPDEIEKQIARAHRGLLPRDVPSELFATFRSASEGTCHGLDVACLRLLAQLVRPEEDSDPPDELWPELGMGAFSAWTFEGASAWVDAVASPADRAARILAATIHPDRETALAAAPSWDGHPLVAVTYGGSSAGATAAAIGELARRAEVPVDLSLGDDGALHVVFPSATADVPACGSARGPLVHPADLARAEAVASAFRRGDLAHARDVAASFEDATTSWLSPALTMLAAVDGRVPPEHVAAPSRVAVAWFLRARGERDRAHAFLPTTPDGLDDDDRDAWTALAIDGGAVLEPAGPRSERVVHPDMAEPTRACRDPLSLLPDEAARLPAAPPVLRPPR